MVDQRCRESEGKAKIEGYMSISDEEAHQWYSGPRFSEPYWMKELWGLCQRH